MSSPIRNLAQVRKTPLPGFRSSTRWAAANSQQDLSVYQVYEYLTQYPAILEEFLLEHTSVDFLKDILEKKSVANGERSQTKVAVKKRSNQRHIASKIDLQIPYSEIGIEQLCKQIMESQSDQQICRKIHEVSRLIGTIVDADEFNMYVLEDSEADLAIYNPASKNTLQHVGPVGHRLTVSAHVAVEKKALNVTDLPQDARFPKGLGLWATEAHHVLCIPILLECGSVYCVVEMVRGWEGDAFTTREFNLALAVLCWIASCVQKIKLNKLLRIQTEMNNYLLESTKIIFDDLDNIDSLVTNIMTFTKELVNADRCSLFLMDEERQELFADFFDEGKADEVGAPLYTKRSQIRFPQGRGIAGYVATSGNIVNIPDAYRDNRFNPDIDKKTGYHTKSILCMPIMGKCGVLGVVQMINSKNKDHFTQEDESAFKMFAVYCAIALHYSRIYNMLNHQQAKYKVAMEVLQYHITANEEETNKLCNDPYIPEEKIPNDFFHFDFCCYDYDALLPQLFIRMIQSSFENVIEVQKLCSFVLTVRKNYRPVSYHNWQHGFHVAHSCWRMLETCKKPIFSTMDKMGMIIAGICHDIDHRGYNNDFVKKLKLPLAALYSTSTMEQHHYKQTVTILHTDGSDIFSFLTADQHRRMLDVIRDNIIATDLALYFGNQKYLSGLIENNEFDYKKTEHIDALTKLIMTAADLCAVPKPWASQKRTTSYIYEEFYVQGDEEKKRGMTPLPMMDRVNKDEIPQQQVGFINFICKPAYQTLSKLLPATRHLYDGCVLNAENWQLAALEKQNSR